MASECAAIFSHYSSRTVANFPRQVICENITLGVPWAYFDGAVAGGLFGVGMVIHTSSDITFAASMGLVSGSNNYAELQTLKLLLCWLLHKDIISVQIFGDSLNIVKWFNKEFICQKYLLNPFLEEPWTLKSHFSYTSVSH